MKKRLQGFIIGVIVTVLLTSSAFAGGIKKTIDVLFNNVNNSVNGQKVQGDNILYNGTTYIPLRKIAEMLGKEVGWDQSTNTASINDKGYLELNKITGQSYIFNLIDDEIKEAINEGKKGFQYVRDYEDTYYKLVPNESIYNILCDVQLITPYHFIMRNSAMKTVTYEEYSFEDAKKINDGLTSTGSVEFEVISYGDSIDSHQNKHFVIKQGDKVIQPSMVTGLDDLGDMTDNWPDSPAYMAIINVSFSIELSEKLGIDTIDFDKKAEFVVIHAPGMESIYEIDFSKFK